MAVANTTKPRLTAERLRSLLHYDPETGLFTRRIGVRGASAGAVAGSANVLGYTQIMIDGTNYLAHRLAWLHMTGRFPEQMMDHRNEIKSDNRWSNLREATKHQNQCNVSKPANNTSGFKGVYWEERTHRWVAQIKVHQRNKKIGRFRDATAAAKAYDVAAIALHGEFANLNFPIGAHPMIGR